MCLHHPLIGSLNSWNWDGDHIVFDAILPSGRPPIGRTKPQYPMDVRQYVATENNVVIRKAVQEEIAAFIKTNGMNAALFAARKPTAFDYRAHVITNFVGQRIKYETRVGRDPWQYPEETLALGTGDCEDIAFVLASLLLASGVSAYNIRVALGTVIVHPKKGRKEHFDHMWVMYKSESGRWQLLEPLHVKPKVPSSMKAAAQLGTASQDVLRIEYRPSFLFNGDHVWMMRDADATYDLQKIVSRDWRRLNPKFLGEVHQTILNTALKGYAPDAMIASLNRHYSSVMLIGPVVDDIDNFVTHGYDSRDHFDNGFIKEGWDRVRQRLRAFKQNNNDLDSFAYAAHGIADFYAHSSYGHFGPLQGGKLVPYDPDKPSTLNMQTPVYDQTSGFNLGPDGPFSPNTHVFKGDRASIPGTWKGQLISGRYAQSGDSQSAIEALTYIPKELLNMDFAKRGSLPHHNTIAVDAEQKESGHILYSSTGKGRLSYANQYEWRKGAAIQHIRNAYLANRRG
jgi:hypothetical protein